MRFTGAVPADAVLGIVYTAVKDKFGEPLSLPILQLPLAMREKDPNLKYQPSYRFTKPGNVLLVGPHNVALSTVPYTNWTDTTPLLSDLLSQFYRLNLFQSVERVSLRYINFFESINIFEHLTLSMKIRDESIVNPSLLFKSEEEKEGFKVITTITNVAQTQGGESKKKGSMLDLDIVKERPNLSGKETPAALLQIMTQSNKLADIAFFRLLTEEFIATMEPEY